MPITDLAIAQRYMEACAAGDQRTVIDIVVQQISSGERSQWWNGGEADDSRGAGGWWCTNEAMAWKYAYESMYDHPGIPVLFTAQESLAWEQYHEEDAAGTWWWHLPPGTPVNLTQAVAVIRPPSEAQSALESFVGQGQWATISEFGGTPRDGIEVPLPLGRLPRTAKTAANDIKTLGKVGKTANSVEDRYGTRANVIGTPGQGDKIFYNRDTDTLIFTTELAPAGAPQLRSGTSNGAYLYYINGELSPGSGANAPTSQTVYNPLFIEALERLVDTFPEFGRRPLYESSAGDPYNTPARISSVWDFLRSINEIRAEYARQRGASRAASRPHDLLPVEHRDRREGVLGLDGATPAPSSWVASGRPIRADLGRSAGGAGSPLGVPPVQGGDSRGVDRPAHVRRASVRQPGPSAGGDPQGQLRRQDHSGANQLGVGRASTSSEAHHPAGAGDSARGGPGSSTEGSRSAERGHDPVRLDDRAPEELEAHLTQHGATRLAAQTRTTETVYDTETYRLRPHAKILNLEECGALVRTILTDAGFPHADEAYAIPHPTSENTSCVAWEVEVYPVPLVALGYNMRDDLTVVHECAHIIRNGPSYAGRQGDMTIAHDDEWFGTFHRLLVRYTHPKLWRSFEYEFGLTPGSGREAKTASGNVIYRGVKVDFPPDVRAKIDALLAPPMEEDEIDQEQGVARVVVDWLQANHWDAGLGLGRHWSTRKEMAETAAMQGASSGVGVVLTATYDDSAVDQQYTESHPLFREAESEISIRPGARITITNVELPGYYGVPKGVPLIDVPIQATASSTVRLWRGLQVADVDDEELEAIRRDPAGFARQHLNDPIGIHWTDDPTSAWNFSQGRDPEGWASESDGFDEDEGGIWTIGLVLEGEVAESDIVQPGTAEHDGYAFSDAILDYGIEREITVRGGTPVRLTSVTVTAVGENGADVDFHAGLGMTKLAWNTNGITLFHGTIGFYADQVLAEGLKPRNATGVANHWSATAISFDGRVYLSHSSRMTVSRSAISSARKVVTKKLYPLEELEDRLWAIRPDNYRGQGITPEYTALSEQIEAMRAQIEADPRLESVILSVTIPPSAWGNLEPDEDTRFFTEPTTEATGFPEWMSSLGSDAVVAYRGEIPTSWIKVQARGRAADQAGMYSPEGSDWRKAASLSTSAPSGSRVVAR